jgi:hypothetical protein
VAHNLPWSWSWLGVFESEVKLVVDTISQGIWSLLLPTKFPHGKSADNLTCSVHNVLQVTLRSVDKLAWKNAYVGQAHADKVSEVSTSWKMGRLFKC